MNVRIANRSQLPVGWHPGEPLQGQSVNLRGAEVCPLGPECQSCLNGLQWNCGLETHLKRPLMDR